MTEKTTKTAPLLFEADEKELPLCPKDEFPIVEADGQRICIAETLDRCVGGQKVTTVMKKGKELSLVFENGHRIPLLCWCCNNPLVYKDFKGFRKYVSGRYLESFGWMINTSTDDRFGYQLELRLVKPSDINDYQDVPTSFQAVLDMYHPRSCPVRKGQSTAEQQKAYIPDFASSAPYFRVGRSDETRLPRDVRRQVERFVRKGKIEEAVDAVSAATGLSPFDALEYITQLQNK